jgi:hypothetical protein
MDTAATLNATRTAERRAILRHMREGGGKERKAPEVGEAQGKLITLLLHTLQLMCLMGHI